MTQPGLLDSPLPLELSVDIGSQIPGLQHAVEGGSHLLRDHACRARFPGGKVIAIPLLQVLGGLGGGCARIGSCHVDGGCPPMPLQPGRRPLQNLSKINSQDYIALHNGSTQAMIHVGMHPDRKVDQSLATGHTRLVAVSGEAIDNLIESNSGFSRITIPANSYRLQPGELHTLALENLLVTSADIDDETVTQILLAIHKAKKQLQYAHPALLDVKIDVESLINSYLHPHPAAILFFQAYR